MPPPEPSAEHERLLPEPAGESSVDSEAPRELDQGPTWQRFIHVLAVGIAVYVSFTLAGAFMSVSSNQLIQGAACQQLYPDVREPYADERCNSDSVQSRLSLIVGWELTFSLMPGMIMAVPYGMLMDRVGVRLFSAVLFVASAVAQALEFVVCLYPETFDLRLIWLAPWVNLIGGGAVVWHGISYAICNSIATDKNRVTIFFYKSVVSTLAEAASGPLVLVAMKRGPAFTQTLGIALCAFSGVLCLAFPRNLIRDKDVPGQGTARPTHTLRQPLTLLKTAALNAKKVFTENIQIGALLVGLVFTTIGTFEGPIRLQYATKRYGWSWSEANLVISTTITINLALMVVVIPAVSHWLLKWYSPLGKDLWMARAGVFALGAGSFATGLAPTAATFIAALALYRVEVMQSPAIMSILTTLAKTGESGSGHLNAVYQCVALASSVGALVSGPLYAEAFRISLRLGEEWIGLPFYVGGCLQVVAVVILFWIREK